MLFFKKKKRAQYPSVYSEWLREFKRLDGVLIKEEDAALFRSGGLKDSKYCIDNFKRELTRFLEKQIAQYFEELGRVVRRYVEENEYDYLILMIRRYHLRYHHLHFFSDLDFLDRDFRDHLQVTLNEKITRYDKELITYFNKLATVSDSMGEVSINIKRLIEV